MGRGEAMGRGTNLSVTVCLNSWIIRSCFCEVHMTESYHDRDRRQDMHSDRRIASAKAAVGAVTLLNSGSWIALLSQVEGLMRLEGGRPILSQLLLYWGGGAFLGSLIWLFIYWNAAALEMHDFDRSSTFPRFQLSISTCLGLALWIASLICFGSGVRSLSALMH